MRPDFSLLHTELNLPPDCSLDEFKRAYRRRIAELHPDKTGLPLSPEAESTMPALISTYDAVTRFHRRYGRMPGASPRSSAGGAARTEGHADTRYTPGVHVPTGADDERAGPPTWRLIFLFIALLAILAAWDWLALQA